MLCHSATIREGNTQFNELRSNDQSHTQSHKAVHTHTPISSLSSVISDFRPFANEIFFRLRRYEA
jgi:hypothetical protein